MPIIGKEELSQKEEDKKKFNQRKAHYFEMLVIKAARVDTVQNGPHDDNRKDHQASADQFWLQIDKVERVSENNNKQAPRIKWLKVTNKHMTPEYKIRLTDLGCWLGLRTEAKQRCLETIDVRQRVKNTLTKIFNTISSWHFMPMQRQTHLESRICSTLTCK